MATTSRKPHRIAAGLLIVVAMALYSIFLLGFDRWVSRKGVARDFGDIKFFTESETSIPPARALRNSEITRKETEEKLSFVWEDTKQRWARSWKGRIPPRFASDERQVVTLPNGGRIRVAWATMGYDPDLDDFPVKEPFTPSQVTVRGDTWEPLDEEAFRILQVETRGKATGGKPRLSSWRPGKFSLDLAFIHEGLPDLGSISRLEVMNLDTMTGVELDSGGNLNAYQANLLFGQLPVEVFYPARLAVGFDFGYGSMEEVRLPLKPGNRAALSDLEIEIVAVERFASSMARNGDHLSRSGNREERATSFQLDPKRDARTHVLFSLSPPELGRFCDVVLVDRDGEQKAQTLGRAYRLNYVTTETLPEDLDELVLRYRPNQARVVFELPSLLGVPPANRDIDNLFDVEIPHLEVDDDFGMEWTVSKQAGVRFRFPDAEFPDDYFPRHYENVSLRELLEEYLDHCPDGPRIRLDRKTHDLKIPEPFSFKKYWKDLRRRIGI